MTPDPASDSTAGRILGIGGIFFKSADHKALKSWYRQNLGIRDDGYGGIFKWRGHSTPEAEHFTTWSVFPAATTYFDPSQATFMVNYIVDDLDAFLAKCSAKAVKIDPKREDYDYGRFAWIYDLDGNKIELWQPLGPIPA
jgi:predicted enzyme related to lactoylglutathione lyase